MVARIWKIFKGNRPRLGGALLENEQGQALIEFILFFPFLLMMYSVTLSIGNAINASINQQKQTRSYFYYRLQNNSTAPTPDRQEGNGMRFSRLGQQVNLWGVKLLGKNPVAACFKFNVALGEAEDDSCEEAYSDPSTQYIRVGTAYGICGATYQNDNGNYIRLPSYGFANEVVAAGACLARK